MVLRESAARWSLSIGDPYTDSSVSLVVPVRRPDGERAVLKIQFPHPESDHEAEALRRWDGDGAIRLLDEDREQHALLLERCVPGRHLATIDSGEVLAVLIGLMPRLALPAAEPFTALSDEARRWANGLEDQWERAGCPFERSIVDAATDMLRDLAHGDVPSVLLHQDLHPDNVLAAQREPWLVIDPKPLVGDAAFAVAPIVRANELGHSSEAVLGRLDRLTTELGLDRHRARGWAVGQTLAWAFEGGLVIPEHVETARWLLQAG